MSLSFVIFFMKVRFMEVMQRLNSHYEKPIVLLANGVLFLIMAKSKRRPFSSCRSENPYKSRLLDETYKIVTDNGTHAGKKATRAIANWRSKSFCSKIF